MKRIVLAIAVLFCLNDARSQIIADWKYQQTYHSILYDVGYASPKDTLYLSIRFFNPSNGYYEPDYVPSGTIDVRFLKKGILDRTITYDLEKFSKTEEKRICSVCVGLTYFKLGIPVMESLSMGEWDIQVNGIRLKESQTGFVIYYEPTGFFLNTFDDLPVELIEVYDLNGVKTENPKGVSIGVFKKGDSVFRKKILSY